METWLPFGAKMATTCWGLDNSCVDEITSGMGGGHTALKVHVR